MDPRAQMVSDCSGRVLHGHVPAAKLNHAPAQMTVHGVQGCLLEIERKCGHASIFRRILQAFRTIKFDCETVSRKPNMPTIERQGSAYLASTQARPSFAAKSPNRRISGVNRQPLHSPPGLDC